MSIVTRAEMLELIELLKDIVVDNKQYHQANKMAKFNAIELRMAYSKYEEYELANFSKWTQDFIKEVRANEA